MSLGSGRGCPKSTGVASFWASPGKAASSSGFVMPQRAVRQAGGGAGMVVVVVVVLVVTAAAVLGGAGGGLACSLGPQAPTMPAATTSRARIGGRRGEWRVIMGVHGS